MDEALKCFKYSFTVIQWNSLFNTVASISLNMYLTMDLNLSLDREFRAILNLSIDQLAKFQI